MIVVSGPETSARRSRRTARTLAFIRENVGSTTSSSRRRMAEVGRPVSIADGSHSAVTDLGWTPDSAGSVVDGGAPGKLLAYRRRRTRLATPDHRQVARSAATCRPERLRTVCEPVPRRRSGDEIPFLGVGPQGDGLYGVRLRRAGAAAAPHARDGPVPFVDLASPAVVARRQPDRIHAPPARNPETSAASTS